MAGCVPGGAFVPRSARSWAGAVGGAHDGDREGARRRGAEALARFAPLLPAVEGDFECGPIALDAPNSYGYAAAFPTQADARSQVVLIYDSTGTLKAFTERRGPPIRPEQKPGMTPLQI